MSDGLRKDLGFDDGDAVYELLINAISGLDDAEAMKVMAKLSLLLANHVGDQAIVEQAIQAAQTQEHE